VSNYTQVSAATDKPALHAAHVMPIVLHTTVDGQLDKVVTIISQTKLTTLNDGQKGYGEMSVIPDFGKSSRRK